MGDLSRELREAAEQQLHNRLQNLCTYENILALLDKADAAEGLLRDLRDGNRLVSDIDAYFEEGREN